MARQFGGGSTDIVQSLLTNEPTQASYFIWVYRTGNGGGAGGRMFNKGDNINGGNSSVNFNNNNTDNTYDFGHQFGTTNGTWRIARPAINEWHNFFIGYDNSSTANDPIIDQDGVPLTVTEASTPSGTPVLTETQRYNVGNRGNDSARVWEGLIAQFAIWNRLLTAAERVALGKGFSPLCFRNGLVEYIPLLRDVISYRLGPPIVVGGVVADHPRTILTIGPSILPALNTGGGGTAPAAPSNLILNAVSATQVDLSFTDNSNDEDSFRIERKTGAGGTYAEVNANAADDVTYTDNTVAANTTYFYRVKARNASGDSAYLTEQSVTTPAAGSAPAAPSSLVATALAARIVMLVWTDNASTEVSFRIERKTGAGGTYTEIGSTATNIISFYDHTAVANTTYFYRVKARNAFGDSAYLTEQSVTTPNTSLAVRTANVQHGSGTDNITNFQRQLDRLLPGADIICVQERTTGSTGWDAGLAAAGFTELVFRENAPVPDQGDGPAIWANSATVTPVQNYSTDLSTGAIGNNDSTDVDKAAVASKVTVNSRTFIIISLHLTWSLGADENGSRFSSLRVGQIREALNWLNNVVVVGSLDSLFVGDFNFSPEYPMGREQTFTANASTDVITANGHPWVNGSTVAVRNSPGGTLPGGLKTCKKYFVRDVTTNTFKLALTSGGAAIDLTSAGTGTHTVSSSGFEQTFTTNIATDDRLTVNGHGWANGSAVVVQNSGGALPSPLTAATIYYLRDVTTNSFNLAASPGGAAIDLTSNGTGTHFIARTQHDLFREAGYTNLWQSALSTGNASAPWGDRLADGQADMPLDFILTVTHDTRNIDHFVMKAQGLVLRHMTMPDSRLPCAGAITGGVCAEVVQTWGNSGDAGPRVSDHNFLLATFDFVANQPPTCNAGSDQNLGAVTQTTLTGTANDPEAQPLTTTWSRVSGPNTPTITTPNALTTTVTGMVAGTYVFRLTVNDGINTPVTDDVQVVIGTNQAPSCNAGADQSLPANTTQTTLTGTANDPEAQPLTTTWSRVSGPNTPTIVSPNSLSTLITGMVAGTYVFRLTVTDGITPVTDDVQVTIAVNQPPTCNAGADQNLAGGTTQTTLTGTASDPEGDTLTRVWSRVSGPNTPTITTPTALTTTVTGMVPGTYVFRLTVNDGHNPDVTDDIQVTIANQPPTVNAGADQLITVGSQTTLSGTATDPDSTLTTTWSRVSGPNTPTIVSPNSLSTLVTGLVVGTYVFRLTVSDGVNAAVTDDVQVIVRSGAPSWSTKTIELFTSSTKSIPLLTGNTKTIT